MYLTSFINLYISFFLIENKGEGEGDKNKQ